MKPALEALSENIGPKESISPKKDIAVKICLFKRDGSLKFPHLAGNLICTKCDGTIEGAKKVPVHYRVNGGKIKSYYKCQFRCVKSNGKENYLGK